MGLNDFILNCEKDNKELKKAIEYYKNKSKRLEKQLRQRDKVIEETINTIDKMINTGYSKGIVSYYPTGRNSEFGCRADAIKNILSKYKNKDEV